MVGWCCARAVVHPRRQGSRYSFWMQATQLAIQDNIRDGDIRDLPEPGHHRNKNQPEKEEPKLNMQSVNELKLRLQQCIQHDDMTGALLLIANFEENTAPMTKEVLEETRIGLIVNQLRKQTQTTHPDLSKKCRKVIKNWQKLVDDGRPGSNGSSGSRGGTPCTPYTPAMQSLVASANQSLVVSANQVLLSAGSPARTVALQQQLKNKLTPPVAAIRSQPVTPAAQGQRTGTPKTGTAAIASSTNDNGQQNVSHSYAPAAKIAQLSSKDQQQQQQNQFSVRDKPQNQKLLSNLMAKSKSVGTELTRKGDIVSPPEISRGAIRLTIKVGSGTDSSSSTFIRTVSPKDASLAHADIANNRRKRKTLTETPVELQTSLPNGLPEHISPPATIKRAKVSPTTTTTIITKEEKDEYHGHISEINRMKIPKSAEKLIKIQEEEEDSLILTTRKKALPTSTLVEQMIADLPQHMAIDLREQERQRLERDRLVNDEGQASQQRMLVKESQKRERKKEKRKIGENTGQNLHENPRQQQNEGPPVQEVLKRDLVQKFLDTSLAPSEVGGSKHLAKNSVIVQRVEGTSSAKMTSKITTKTDTETATTSELLTTCDSTSSREGILLSEMQASDKETRNWYDILPPLKDFDGTEVIRDVGDGEIEDQDEDQVTETSGLQASDSNKDRFLISIRDRQVLGMPYVDLGLPDFEQYSFPYRQNYLAEENFRYGRLRE